MKNRKPSPASKPRSEKARRGRTDAATTPFEIRSDQPLDDAAQQRIRRRFVRKLGKYALHIERATLRLVDVNGPRGGVDTACRMRLAVSGLPPIVVEERGAEPDFLAHYTIGVAERALHRAIERSGRSMRTRPRGAEGRARAAEADVDEGSLIGRRVGRAPANLARALARPEKERGDAYVDTAAPGTSATDRRAGYGATARRNTRNSGSAQTSALEDSRSAPSRKSTRKSQGRSRPSSPLERTESLKSVTPKARATRAQAARKGKGRR